MEEAYPLARTLSPSNTAPSIELAQLHEAMVQPRRNGLPYRLRLLPSVRRWAIDLPRSDATTETMGLIGGVGLRLYFEYLEAFSKLFLLLGVCSLPNMLLFYTSDGLRHSSPKIEPAFAAEFGFGNLFPFGVDLAAAPGARALRPCDDTGSPSCCREMPSSVVVSSGGGRGGACAANLQSLFYSGCNATFGGASSNLTVCPDYCAALRSSCEGTNVGGADASGSNETYCRSLLGGAGGGGGSSRPVVFANGTSERPCWRGSWQQFGLEQETIAEARNDRPLQTSALIELLIGIVLICFYHWFKRQQLMVIKDQDADMISLGDYTVQVSCETMPSDTTEKELREFMEQRFGKVANVIMCYDNDELIQLFQIKGKLKYELGIAMAKGTDAVAAGKRKRLEEVNAQIKVEAARSIVKGASVDTEHAGADKPYETVSAFVTFELAEMYELCLKWQQYAPRRTGRPRGIMSDAEWAEMSESQRLRCNGRDMRGKQIQIEPAPEPDVVRWENLEYSAHERKVRRRKVNLIVTSVLLLSFIAITFFKGNAQDLSHLLNCGQPLHDKASLCKGPSQRFPERQAVDIDGQMESGGCCAADAFVSGSLDWSVLDPQPTKNESFAYYAKCFEAESLHGEHLAQCDHFKDPQRLYRSGTHNKMGLCYSCLCNELATSESEPASSLIANFEQRSGMSSGEYCQAFTTFKSKNADWKIIATFSVVAINQLLKIMLVKLVEHEKPHTIEKQQGLLCEKVFIAQIFNTGLLVLIFSTDPQCLGLGGLSTMMPGSGDKYCRWNSRWFNTVGAAITQTMLIQAMLPPTISVFKGKLLAQKKRLIVWATMSVHEGRSYAPLLQKLGLSAWTQAQLNRAMEGPDFQIAASYGESFLLLFVTLMYAPGLPILFWFAAFGFRIKYMADRAYILRTARKPPLLGDQFAETIGRLLPGAICVHLFFAAWILVEFSTGENSSLNPSNFNVYVVPLIVLFFILSFFLGVSALVHWIFEISETKLEVWMKTFQLRINRAGIELVKKEAGKEAFDSEEEDELPDFWTAMDGDHFVEGSLTSYAIESNPRYADAFAHKHGAKDCARELARSLRTEITLHLVSHQADLNHSFESADHDRSGLLSMRQFIDCLGEFDTVNMLHEIETALTRLDSYDPAKQELEQGLHWKEFLESLRIKKTLKGAVRSIISLNKLQEMGGVEGLTNLTPRTMSRLTPRTINAARKVLGHDGVLPIDDSTELSEALEMVNDEETLRARRAAGAQQRRGSSYRGLAVSERAASLSTPSFKEMEVTEEYLKQRQRQAADDAEYESLEVSRLQAELSLVRQGRDPPPPAVSSAGAETRAAVSLPPDDSSAQEIQLHWEQWAEDTVMIVEQREKDTAEEMSQQLTLLAQEKDQQQAEFMLWAETARLKFDEMQESHDRQQLETKEPSKGVTSTGTLHSNGNQMSPGAADSPMVIPGAIAQPSTPDETDATAESLELKLQAEAAERAKLFEDSDSSEAFDSDEDSAPKDDSAEKIAPKDDSAEKISELERQVKESDIAMRTIATRSIAQRGRVDELEAELTMVHEDLAKAQQIIDSAALSATIEPTPQPRVDVSSPARTTLKAMSQAPSAEDLAAAAAADAVSIELEKERAALQEQVEALEAGVAAAQAQVLALEVDATAAKTMELAIMQNYSELEQKCKAARQTSSTYARQIIELQSAAASDGAAAAELAAEKEAAAALRAEAGSAQAEVLSLRAQLEAAERQQSVASRASSGASDGKAQEAAELRARLDALISEHAHSEGKRVAEVGSLERDLVRQTEKARRRKEDLRSARKLNHQAQGLIKELQAKLQLLQARPPAPVVEVGGSVAWPVPSSAVPRPAAAAREAPALPASIDVTLPSPRSAAAAKLRKAVRVTQVVGKNGRLVI